VQNKGKVIEKMDILNLKRTTKELMLGIDGHLIVWHSPFVHAMTQNEAD
jgi:hypothetical protein